MTVNCAPIMDDGNTVRGCLVTFDDLSVVEHMNQALLDSVAQLEVAKKQIEEHNAELKRIADVDQLTGALTRRAFLNQAQQQFRESAAHRRRRVLRHDRHRSFQIHQRSLRTSCW